MISATTKRDRIKGAPAAYDRQYSKHYGEAFLAGGGDPYDTTLALRKLNLETCSESDIAGAIGNASWTELKCDVCGTDVTVRAELEGPYERMGICGDCLASAAQAIETRRAETQGGSVHESAVAEGDAP